MTYTQSLDLKYELLDLIESGKENSPRAKEIAKKLRNAGY